MPITGPLEIITGVGRLYRAAYGTTFPAVNATPAAAWTELGETQDGVILTPEGDVEEIRLDQISGPVKGVRPEEGLKIKTKLAQATLERLANLSGNTVTDTAPGVGTIGYRTLPLAMGQEVDECALIVRGASPYLAGANGQWQFPRVYVAAIGDITYTKDGNVAYEVEFGVLWDFAAAAGSEMGHLVAQDAAALP